MKVYTDNTRVPIKAWVDHVPVEESAILLLEGGDEQGRIPTYKALKECRALLQPPGKTEET